MHSEFVLHLFGPLTCQMGGRALPRLRTKNGYLTLATLTLRAGTPVRRDYIIGNLWPDSDDKEGSYNLRRALTDLRRALGPEARRLIANGHHSLIWDAEGMVVDVRAFDAAAARWEKIGDIAAAQQAIALYRGSLMEGFDAPFLQGERAAREQTCLTLLEAVASHALTNGDPERALVLARRAETLDPLRQSCQRLLYQSLIARGDRPAAERAYRDFRIRLRRETGQEPDTELKAGFGERATTKERAGASPALSTKPSPRSPKPALPLFLTAFHGREKEQGRIAELLESPETRLVTLTGLGGMGKTRLAVAAAEEAFEAFPDGIHFVTLADVNAPEALPEFVLETLGSPCTRDADALTQLCDALNDKRALLILDNLEQLLPDGARFAETLLKRLPSLKILVTSRHSLYAAGEREFPVPPLPVPVPSSDLNGRKIPMPPAQLRDYPSVRLFVERAKARRADFDLTPENAEAVAALCVSLEGIPLALELAAAWAATLTPAETNALLTERFQILATRHADVPERQRSLRAVLDGSYRALPLEVQRFFARLSVFRGGWTLEAAEVICQTGEDISGLRPFDALSQLREASLILSEAAGATTRYRFLETVREYAAERLNEEERKTTERRHTDFFLSYAEKRQTEDPLTRNYTDIERDYENFRIVLSRSLPPEDDAAPDTARRMWIALRDYWNSQGHWGEGQRWSDAVAAHAASFSPSERVRVLVRAGGWMYYRRHPPAEGYLTQAIELGEACNEWEAVARARTLLALQKEMDGDAATAESHLRQVVARANHYPASEVLINALDILGNIARVRGRYEEAQDYYRRGLALYRSGAMAMSEVRLCHGIAYTLEQLGNTAWHLCAFDDARRLHEEAIALMKPWGEEKGGFGHKFGLAEVARCEGKREEAQCLYEECIEEARKRNQSHTIAKGLAGLGNVLRARGKFDAARVALRESLTIRRDSGSKWSIMNCLEAFAHLAAAEGNATQAARLYGAANVLRTELASPIPPPERPDYDRCFAHARAALTNANGDSAFDAAFADGQTTPLETLIAELLSP